MYLDPNAVADTIAANPTIAALVLAFLLSPHFALMARYVVNLTPKNWDNVALDVFLAVLKTIAGVVPDAPKPEQEVDPNTPPAPAPSARRGILRRLFG